MLSTFSGSVHMDAIFSSEGPIKCGTYSQSRQGKGKDGRLYQLQQEPKPIWWPGATM